MPVLTPEQIDAIPDEKTFVLRKPIKLEGLDEVTEITLYEPTTGQIKKMAKMSDDEAISEMISINGGVPKKVVDMIVARDLTKMSDYLTSFMPAAPATGG